MTPKLKVLWFTNNACSAIELLNPMQSSGGWLASLEKELSGEEGVELHVGFYYGRQMESFRHGDTFFHPLLRQNRKNKFTRYIGRLFAREYNDQKDQVKIKHVIDHVNPDIIHIHGTEENFGLIQGYRSIPTVVSIQGLLNPYLEKYYSGIPKHVARRYESLIDKLAWRSAGYTYKSMKVRAEREARILRKARYILGRTEWDRAVTQLLSPGSIYFVGQEALRHSFYTSHWHGFPYKETYKIFTITGESMYKGFEMIVKAAQLLKHFPDFEFEWRVAGVNEYSQCVRIVTKWLHVDLRGINVILLGNQRESQLAESLITSDLFCQVSHIENSPNSLCEAMMVGIPIIASNAGGTGSLLENDLEGLLIQDGDPFILAGSIIRLAKDFNKARQLAITAKSRASKRHDKKEIVRDLIATYKGIVKHLV